MHAILLTGAALIGLPILLHLIMRQEPKRLQFPAFRFLKLRRRINQRKLRLRHWLLLALRMLLIALVALALFQPTLLSDRFNIKGDSPVACVIVIDTSPSMGYVLSDRSGLTDARRRGMELLEEKKSDNNGNWTALDEARARAMELINELPPGSRVTVLGTDDRKAVWTLSLDEARKKVREIKRPRAASRSVTQTLELAYNHFLNWESEAPLGQQNYPRLLCVISDRTAPSWQESLLSNLQSRKKQAVWPKGEDAAERPIHSVYLDVGVNKPLNLAITGVEMKPQIVPANKPVEFTVLLEAFGGLQENTIQVRFDDENELLKQAVRVEPGFPAEVVFRREGLAPGLHQAEITLQTADGLPADNIRYLTFKVREPRNVLIVADALRPGGGMLAGAAGDVAKLQDSSWLLRASLEATGWYACEVRSSADFVSMPEKQLARFEAIVLAHLVQPSPDLWTNAGNYVQAGGQLIVVPGADDLLVNPEQPPPGYADRLLPATLTRWVEVPRDGDQEVTWMWDRIRDTGMLSPFKDWLRNPKIDFVGLSRPRVWGYWEVEVRDKSGAVIIEYNDEPRRPALLEKAIGPRGRVLLFTTPLDGRVVGNLWAWNNYASTSFHMVITNLAVRYLTGDTEDAVFNYDSGTTVLVRWPIDAGSRSKTYYLVGPDVTDADSVLVRENRQAILQLGPDKLRAAGNYEVLSDPTDKDHPRWRDGFSLNATGEESNLERVSVEAIESLFGEKSVAAADKELKLQEILRGKFSAPIELFPFLMILLLLFLAFENLLSNRFYKNVKPKEGAG